MKRIAVLVLLVGSMLAAAGGSALAGGSKPGVINGSHHRPGAVSPAGDLNGGTQIDWER